MAWVALWLFDEAASGTGPASVLDSVASPVNLPITYDGATWTSVAAGRGLQLPDDTGARASNSSIGSTKLAFTSGLTAFTIEATVGLNFSGGTWQSRGFFELEDQSVAQSGVYVKTDHTISSFSGVFDGAAFSCSGTSPSMTTPHVFHWVFDPTNATADDRFRFYVDGVRASDTNSFTGSEVLENIDRLWIGFGEHGGGSAACTFYEAAFADHAADASEIASRATALLANNDADPASAPEPPAVVAVTTFASDFERRRVLL